MPFPPLLQVNPPDPGSFASSAAAAHTAQISAANQAAERQRLQQQAQAAQVQRDFQNDLDLLGKGALPSTVEQPGPSGLKTRVTNPAIAQMGGKGQYVTDPAGTRHYIPTDEEKERAKLDNTNSFEVQPGTDEEQFLSEAIGYKPGSKQRIPFSHVGAISAFANNLQQAADLAEKRKQTGKVTQTLHDSLLEHGVDIPVGAALPYAEIDNLVNTAKAPAKTTKALHWENTTDDKGNVHVRSYDEDGKLAKEYTYPGEGKATKQGDEVKPPSKSLLTQIENRKNQALRKAREDYRIVVTPVSGLDVDEKTKKQAAANLKQDLQAAQDAYEAELATATGHDIEHNDWADFKGDDGGGEQAPASAQPAQAPAAATQQPTARKLTGQPVKGQGPPAEGPPTDVVQKLAPGTHTFGNGQVWKKNQDGSMTFVGGGK